MRQLGGIFLSRSGPAGAGDRTQAPLRHYPPHLPDLRAVRELPQEARRRPAHRLIVALPYGLLSANVRANRPISGAVRGLGSDRFYSQGVRRQYAAVLLVVWSAHGGGRYEL